MNSSRIVVRNAEFMDAGSLRIIRTRATSSIIVTNRGKSDTTGFGFKKPDNIPPVKNTRSLKKGIFLRRAEDFILITDNGL